MVQLSLSTFARHLATRVRAKFGHTNPRLDAGAAELRTLKRMDFIKTDPYIAKAVEKILSSEPGNRKVPFDILQGLVRGAVYNDRKCQDNLLRLHTEFLEHPELYSPKERRIIRKGYLMLDLYCLVGTKFTTWAVVNAVRRQFFFKPMDEQRLPDDVFRAYIHHAVSVDELPRMTANQILVLHSVNDTDEESKIERAVFEDKDVFGPYSAIYIENGKVIDRPTDVSMYDGMILAEDLANAPQSREEMEQRLQTYTEELQQYVTGDRRPEAFDSVTTVSSSSSQRGGSREPSIGPKDTTSPAADAEEGIPNASNSSSTISAHSKRSMLERLKKLNLKLRI